MQNIKKLGLGALAGAVAAFFLDKDSGRRRRHMTRDRTLAFFRRGGRRTARATSRIRADAQGMVERARHVKEPAKSYDDATLKSRLESELFRDPGVPKGQINILVTESRVELRGECQSQALIDDLGRQAQRVQGVKGVTNLLHLPDRAPTAV